MPEEIILGMNEHMEAERTLAHAASWDTSPGLLAKLFLILVFQLPSHGGVLTGVVC